MNEKLVSVIVPIYNVENYLDACLRSITEQTYKNLEIIVVNDGSTDSSAEIAKKWAFADARLSVFDKENGGLASARNYGLTKFSGDFVTFVDSDDLLNVQMIEKLVAAVTADNAEPQQIAVCKVTRELTDFEVSETRAAQKIVHKFEPKLRLAFSDSAFPTGSWGKLYPRELMTRLTFPDTRIFEDMLLLIQLLDLSSALVYVDYFGYYYRPNPKSLTTTGISDNQLYFLQMNTERLALVAKNHPSALTLMQEIVMRDNDALARKCVLSKSSPAADTLFHQLWQQNRLLSADVNKQIWFYKSEKVYRFLLTLASSELALKLLRLIAKKKIGQTN
ncbi:MAG: glycosyltransferase family 2 protein [Streptococcaceae bacterium]|jgi:glycosyltransferase involved in cell wall biosynthesis|nr:glycosyltransferase family 2 protein [Streptococcaceae bacterium]